MSTMPSQKPSLAVAQEQVRLAGIDLERWQGAYDSYRGDDAQAFHAEIRAAEEGLDQARAWLGELRKV